MFDGPKRCIAFLAHSGWRGPFRMLIWTICRSGPLQLFMWECSSFFFFNEALLIWVYGPLDPTVFLYSSLQRKESCREKRTNMRKKKPSMQTIRLAWLAMHFIWIPSLFLIFGSWRFFCFTCIHIMKILPIHSWNRRGTFNLFEILLFFLFYFIFLFFG